jgi:hypothetical protein
MADSKRYEVTVTSQNQYVAEQSDEANGRFVFAYTITIRNTGSMPAQLIARHWIIKDANNIYNIDNLTPEDSERQKHSSTVSVSSKRETEDGAGIIESIQKTIQKLSGK